jgi:hypothetical protein
MANPPVNPKQFKGHEQHLSALENQHKVEFTGKGLNYRGGFALTSNVNSSGFDGIPPSWHGNAPKSTISLHLPTEDPDVSNNLHLFSPSADEDHPASGVETVENHSYLNAETGEHEPRSRWNWHPDVPSAIDYMREGYQQRRQHLEDKTMPEPTGNGDYEFHPDNQGMWRDDFISDYSATPAEIKESGLIPPSVIAHSAQGESNDTAPYPVDASTRQRLPDKDQ